MSTEAPRNTGRGEPIHSQRPDGVFSGLLRRLFGVPSKLQPTYQPPSRIVQLPPELSDFVAEINKGMEEGLTMAQQAELERIRWERQWTEKRVGEKEAMERQRSQHIEGRLQDLEAIKQIAEQLKIQDRLAYINATVWEGKGQIRDNSTTQESATNDVQRGFNPRASVELAFSYQSAHIQESQGSHDGYSWRYGPTTETTSLQVCVHSVDGKTYLDVISPCLIEEKWEKIRDKIKWGHGVYGNNDDHSVNSVHGAYVWEGHKWMAGWGDVPIGVRAINRIPLDRLSEEETEEKLTQALVKETTERTRKGAVPSKLILAGQKIIRQAKVSPQWMKWKYVSGTD